MTNPCLRSLLYSTGETGKWWLWQQSLQYSIQQVCLAFVGDWLAGKTRILRGQEFVSWGQKGECKWNTEKAGQSGQMFYFAADRTTWGGLSDFIPQQWAQCENSCQPGRTSSVTRLLGRRGNHDQPIHWFCDWLLMVDTLFFMSS